MPRRAGGAEVPPNRDSTLIRPAAMLRRMSERSRIFRAVMTDPNLHRIELAFLGFNMTEFATWIAILVYAFERGGARGGRDRGADHARAFGDRRSDSPPTPATVSGATAFC